MAVRSNNKRTSFDLVFVALANEMPGAVHVCAGKFVEQGRKRMRENRMKWNDGMVYHVINRCKGALQIFIQCSCEVYNSVKIIIYLHSIRYAPNMA